MALMPFKRKQTEDGDRAAFDREIDTVLRVLTQYPPESRLSFGAPVRCPVCTNFGLVEHVDRVHGRSSHRCVSCGHEWIMTVRAMRAARDVVSTSFGPHSIDAPTAGFDREDLDATTGVVFRRDLGGEVSRKVLTPAGASFEDEALEPTPPLTVERAPMRVLLVEDNPMDVEVVKAILGPAGRDVVDLRCAKTRAAGEEAARTDAPDLVLLDLGLPDSHGFQTVTRWHFNSVVAPVMVVSGEYGAEVVERGRELGVTGFLDKAELADLLAAGDEGTTEFIDRLESAVLA